MPDSGDKGGESLPRLKTFVCDHALDRKGRHLRKCSEISPDQRTRILRKGLTREGTDTKTRHVQRRQSNGEFGFLFGAVIELILDDITPEILDESEEDDMQDLDRCILMCIETFTSRIRQTQSLAASNLTYLEFATRG